MAGLTHIDDQGDAVMVDVGDKTPTRREAIATGRIHLGAAAATAVRNHTAKKGDVLAVAQLAGIQAAKRTGELIPLCHPLFLSGIRVTLRLDEDATAVVCRARVRTEGRTGVEMEALTAVCVALLTVYDMLKAVDPQMRIDGVELVQKTKTPLS